MDGNRFDALTRGISAGTNRRGLLKGLAAAVAGVAGFRAIEDEAGATGMARLTIHNAQCQRESGDLYTTCHDNGFGCVNFTFRGRTIRTNSKGVVTARIGSGRLSISQQASRVRKSSSIFVYCSDTRNGKVLFDAAAPTGLISFSIPANANVVCDWYNISTSDLSMPGQCPRQTTTPRPTTSTTPRPTTTTTGGPPTTTTTTTTEEPCPQDGIWVDPGAGTLSTAITSAPSGAVICLKAGTYNVTSGSNVGFITKPLTILGNGSTGADASVIESIGGRDGLIVTQVATIKNVRFSVLGARGVVTPSANADVLIEKCHFEGNFTNPSAGIEASSYSKVTVKNSTITKCAQAAFANYGTLNFVGSSITGNGIPSSVVLQSSGVSDVTLDGTTSMTSNSSSQGIRVNNGGKVTVNGATISGNSASIAVIVLANGTFINNGGTIKDNTSSSPGGIAYLVTPNTNTFTDSSGIYSGNNGSSHACDAVWDGSTCCTPSNSSCTTS